MSDAISAYSGTPTLSAFERDTYVARKNIFNFWGVTCRILTEEDALLAVVHQKALRLKEEITAYSDEQQTRALLTIKARSIIDFSATYDVTDVATGQKVGALKRKGFKSMLRDEWSVLDANDQEIGLVREDSMLMAMLRRFLAAFVPQNFDMLLGTATVGTVRGTWNPFVNRYTVDLTADKTRQLDRRLALAAVVLLLLIEGKQQ